MTELEGINEWDPKKDNVIQEALERQNELLKRVLENDDEEKKRRTNLVRQPIKDFGPGIGAYVGAMPMHEPTLDQMIQWHRQAWHHVADIMTGTTKAIPESIQHEIHFQFFRRMWEEYRSEQNEKTMKEYEAKRLKQVGLPPEG